MRRWSRALLGVLFCCAVLALTVWSGNAAGKGGDKDKGAGGPGTKVKISTQFVDFPLPFAAELVPKNRHKAGAEWTVYRINMSILTLTAFYKTQMPGRGWKLRTNRGNSWTWVHGRRTIIVVYVRISSLFSFIQVREMR